MSCPRASRHFKWRLTKTDCGIIDKESHALQKPEWIRLVNVLNLNPHCQKGRAQDLSEMPTAWSECCRQSHRLKCYTPSTPIYSVRGSSCTHLTREIITEFHLPAKLHGRRPSRLGWKLSCTSTVEWGAVEWGNNTIWILHGSWPLAFRLWKCLISVWRNPKVV